MNIDELVRELQEELGVSVDGKAGPETWGAIYKRVLTKTNLPASFAEAVDPRSEKNIATLLPEAQPYARALVHKAEDIGIAIKVISGTRTYEEQDTLYAQGRTLPGDIVTKAKGGESNHNFGLAFDIGVFEAGNYLNESPKYKAVGAIGVDLGLEWGGDWKSIEDQPHFQLRPIWAETMTEKQMLAALRVRVASGQSLFA